MVLMLGLVVLAVANQKDVSFIFQSMDWRGLVLALLAVVADAMVSLIQEICMKKDDHAQYQKEEPVTVIFYSYGFGFVVLLLYSTILSDEFWTVSKFAYSNPKFIGILFV
jgi:drug/metabolite transporter (DMT)-like permease